MCEGWRLTTFWPSARRSVDPTEMLLRDVGGVTCHDENVAVVLPLLGEKKKLFLFPARKPDATIRQYTRTFKSI